MYRTRTSLARVSAAFAFAVPLALSSAGAVRADASATIVATALAIPTASIDVIDGRSAPPSSSGAIGSARVVLDLLVASGVEHSLEAFVAATLEAGAEGASAGADDVPDAESRVALITDALKEAFAMTRLRPIVARNVSAAIGPGDADTMLAHYRSDLGQRLRHASRTRRPAADPSGYARFVAAFGSRPGEAERLAVLDGYVRDSDAAGLVARFLIETRVTSLHAMLALSGDASRPRLEREMASTMNRFEPIRAALAERLPVTLAYTYDGFSDDELRTMAAAELSEAGRRVTGGVFDGFREVAVAGNADFVARVRGAMSLAELQDEI